MRTLALLLTGSLTLLGCTADHGEQGEPQNLAVQRLGLQRLETGNPEPATILERRPGDQPGQWKQREGRDPKLVRAGDRTSLRLDIGQPDSAWVALQVHSQAFDLLEVTVSLPEGAQELIRTGLHQGSDTLLVSEMLEVTGTGTPQTLTFVLEGIERLGTALDQVSIQVAARAPWAEVHGISLLDARAAALLPTPGGDPALVDHGAQARRGWGLDDRVTGQLEIPRDLPAGSRLHLAYAVHPGAEGHTLQVRTADGVQHEAPLGHGAPEWRTLTIENPAPGPAQLILAGSPTAGAAWTAVAELQVVRPTAARAPLVLLVTSDTHRADHLSLTRPSGSRGADWVHTPALARLAGRGVAYLDALAPSNMTNPSHSAILSGLSPRDTRIVGNRAPLAAEAVTIAERFALAGYATAAAVSAQHIGHAYSGLGQGFDRFDGMEERSDYRFTKRDGAVAVERAMEWIHERADVPLFLWVHLFDAHSPYEAPGAFTAPYLSETRRPLSSELDPVPSGSVPGWIASDPALQQDVLDAHARYRAAVDRVDVILEPLLESPRALAGITAFVGDHGEAFGRNNLWWTHHGLYTDQLDVPLLLAAPALPMPPGWLSTDPVSAIHLGATLLDLAGLDASDHPSPGLPLEPRDPDAPAEPRFALGYAGLKAAVEHEGWLLILSLQDHEYDRGPRSFRKGDRELFYLPTDRACAEDRAAVEPERCARLEAALVRWLDQADPEGLAGAFNVSAGAQQRLIELGYAGNLESTRAGAWYVPDER